MIRRFVNIFIEQRLVYVCTVFERIKCCLCWLSLNCVVSFIISTIVVKSRTREEKILFQIDWSLKKARLKWIVTTRHSQSRWQIHIQFTASSRRSCFISKQSTDNSVNWYYCVPDKIRHNLIVFHYEIMPRFSSSNYLDTVW